MDPRESRSARLHRSLEDLMRQAPEIAGALIVSNDGFLVASTTDEGESVGPIAANLFDLGNKATQRLSQGNLKRIIVDAEEGTLAAVPAGPHAVLISIVRKQQAKLGVVVELMVRQARIVEELIE